MSNTSSFWFQGEDAPDEPTNGQSLRFRGGQRLSRAFNQTYGTNDMTLSMWVKRAELGRIQTLCTFDTGVNGIPIRFTVDDNLVSITQSPSSTTTADGLYRDPSAWYHIVVNSTTCWVNGRQVSQGTLIAGSDGQDDCNIGAYGENNTEFFDGYIADVYLVQQNLEANAFGEYDENDVWVPREVSFAYGQNSYSSELWASSTNSPPDFDSTTPYPISSGSQGFDGQTNTYNHGGAGVPNDGTLIWRLGTPVENVTGIRFYGSTFEPTWYINRVEQPVSVYNVDGLGPNHAQVYSGAPITVSELAIKCGNNGNAPGWAAIEFQIDGGDYYIVVDPNTWSKDLWVLNSSTYSEDPAGLTKDFLGTNDATKAFDGNVTTPTTAQGDTNVANGWLIWLPDNGIDNVNRLRIASTPTGAIRVNGVDITDTTPALPQGSVGSPNWIEINNPPATITSIGVSGNSSVPNIQGIEINGQIYIDGQNPNYGVNGFHLDFADPNDIGKDVSGNGNDFTPTGFDTAPTVKQTGQYVDETANLQASGGVFPNTGGTPYWTDVLPANAYNSYPDGTYTPVANQGLYAMFSGDTTILGSPVKYDDVVYWVSGYSGRYPYSANFDLRDFPEVTSVEVLHKSADVNGLWNFWLLDDSKNKIAGTDASTNVTGPSADHFEWLNIPVAGTPRYLHMEAKNSGSSNIVMRAFKVNGTVLSQADYVNPNYDLMTDSPTQNFATFNPLVLGASNFSNGNLNVTANGSNSANRGTPNSTFKMPSSGKYYAEFTPTSIGEITVGLTQEGNGNTVINYYHLGSITLVSGSAGTGSSYTTGDVIGVAVDVDNTTVRFYKNGTAQLSSATDYSSAPDSDNCYLTFKQGSSTGSCTATANYGQQPFLYTPPAGFEALQTLNLPEAPILNGSDHFQAITGAGSVGGLLYTEIYGQEPDPGTVTTNPLTLPLTSLDITYSGQGVNNPSGSGGSGGATAWQHVWDAGESITTVDMTWLFQSGTHTFAYSNDGTTWFGTESSSGETSKTHAPGAPFRYIRRYSNSAGSQQHTADQGIPILGRAIEAFPYGLWWIKDRDNNGHHQLVDSLRGSTITSTCPDEAIEQTYAAPPGQSIAWCWKAGDGVVTNNAGTLESQVSVNTDAGFSIVTYTGNGANAPATIGHGLNQAPEFMILMFRNTTGQRTVYHEAIGNTSRLRLNSNIPIDTNIGHWNNTSPTDEVFTVGNNFNQGPVWNYVTYCWHSVPGYSAFGSYTSTNTNDGPFCYLGFRPAFLMVKNADLAQDVSGEPATGSWMIVDSTRDIDNPTTQYLRSNFIGPEYNGRGSHIDLLSNGFKLRASYGEINGGTDTYVYCAWAENPFSYPANAR